MYGYNQKQFILVTESGKYTTPITITITQTLITTTCNWHSRKSITITITWINYN